ASAPRRGRPPEFDRGQLPFGIGLASTTGNTTCWRARASRDHVWLSAGFTRGPLSACAAPSMNSIWRALPPRSRMRTLRTAASLAGSVLPLYASPSGSAACSSDDRPARCCAAESPANAGVMATVPHDSEALLLLSDSASDWFGSRYSAM